MARFGTLLVALVAGFATPIAGAARHQYVGGIPLGWSLAGKPADSDTITLSIGLKLSNEDLLEKTLLAISTPGSPEYGKWLEKDEVDKLFQPSKSSDDAVQKWLKSAGVNSISSDGTWINFATNVGTANSLLNASFAQYENDGLKKLRTTQYSIPAEVAGDIDLVTPTIEFMKTNAAKMTDAFGEPLELMKKKRQVPTPASVAPSCATSVTPSCLKQFYNLGGYEGDAKSGSRIGFASFLNESARYEDLKLFDDHFGIPYKPFDVITINGGFNNQTANPIVSNSTVQIQLADTNAEADGDSQLISSITDNALPITEYITGGTAPYIPNLDEPAGAPSNEPYVEYYRYLLSQPNSKLPQVISASYGDDEQSVPEDYAKRVCFMIGQMGLRGISLLGSSGDNGVGAPCQSNDGKKTPQFTPQFPSTCPWFTSVGGTQASDPEIAWLGSGGGFSNYFTRPKYQDAFVGKYLEKVVDPEYYEHYTNFSMRGFPDVAAHSADPRYVYYQDNVLWRRGFAGTSAACPVFSAIVSLLNDARLKAGKPRLGFLNPMFYAVGYKGLIDVAQGRSIGCTGLNFQNGNTTIEGASVIPGVSWNATEGWDPATGLGLPDFQALKSIVLEL
ncbi:Pro-kumamolisin [Rhizodiscina lignyota]|uniref:tripeptidyl-peptidase II n=1 Tax=Rhizodiscina lignyota TaxID=1504668 RepID=A0A9P4ISQ7_9PEZI|nr:Pro-kumamolisin [Rhizodiscina lignyota]